MKIVGIILIWCGVVFFLKNNGYIDAVTWTTVWPVLLIIIGSSLKHCRSMMHGMMCKGGNCGMCAGGKCGGEGKCEGPNCKH